MHRAGFKDGCAGAGSGQRGEDVGALILILIHKHFAQQRAYGAHGRLFVVRRARSTNPRRDRGQRQVRSKPRKRGAELGERKEQWRLVRSAIEQDDWSARGGDRKEVCTERSPSSGYWSAFTRHCEPWDREE